ncbi:MAG: hypothetical protein KAQ79_11370, partial [Cyclobacteriaceae bacterium]|nr:hypothetical protein [Cyclobacteriaceae bacterium]
MKLKFLSIIIISLFLNSLSDVLAQNWPNWRGINGDGTSAEINLPTQWDSITNVVWKSSFPGTGHASPIIWGDRLFTVTALLETQEK